MNYSYKDVQDLSLKVIRLKVMKPLVMYNKKEWINKLTMYSEIGIISTYQANNILKVNRWLHHTRVER